MKINTKVNGKDIVLILTKEQLQEIKNQTSDIKTLDDLHSISDAELILQHLASSQHIKYSSSDFKRTKDWANYQLETIIKAANYIDNNNQIWKADFDNTNEWKYIPYFIKKVSGWLADCVHAHSYISSGSVWEYYKKESTAKLFSERFITLYNQKLEL